MVVQTQPVVQGRIERGSGPGDRGFLGLVGALSLRTKGAYFIMVTLAFAQMAYYVVHDTPLGGGTDGIYLMIKPVLGTFLDLDKASTLYGFTLFSLVLVAMILCYMV